MAAPKRDAAAASPLARVMREFDELVRALETGLLRSLNTTAAAGSDTLDRDSIRREACRLAVSDLSTKYARKHIRQSLHDAECAGKRVEDHLQTITDTDNHHHHHPDLYPDHGDGGLCGLHNGYFRLYSTELFDLLGQPTDLRFGSLRFHKSPPLPCPRPDLAPHAPASWVNVELALNDSFFVADSLETLPYHTFRLPTTPSLQNRGILSRKPEDNGVFPTFDSWLLFTFLGNGCIKLEVPVEMCADVYGGPLRGCENDEVLFWGFFVDDDMGS
ncbi:hypothetical protein FB567DRAFT_224905 [Paraphoma chrysanthemicola]|uniref:Uncharacterized protein n=1 Tax=Paraphoma chrysanthemicola TaxID=798071 RepID=A0A8K0QUW5_9PLEO|nr:hypothetical protein FB567DRAFT_224905 [Paraphoma chrysanthemicola]